MNADNRAPVATTFRELTGERRDLMDLLWEVRRRVEAVWASVEGLAELSDPSGERIANRDEGRHAAFEALQFISTAEDRVHALEAAACVAARKEAS